MKSFLFALLAIAGTWFPLFLSAEERPNVIGGEVNSDITPEGKIKRGAPKAQLYDLANNPTRKQNVIPEHAERAASMEKHLEEIRKGKTTRTTPVTTPQAKAEPATQTGAKRPPNFVVIFADDLGYGDLGCYGAL